MPCVPSPASRWASARVPQIGAGVWVEFEQGDPDYPIWIGCCLGLRGGSAGAGAGRAVRRAEHRAADRAQNTLMISDMPGPTGGILLKTTTGAMISVNDTGITISNGKGAMIIMTGPAVDINAAALTIT